MAKILMMAGSTVVVLSLLGFLVLLLKGRAVTKTSPVLMSLKALGIRPSEAEQRLCRQRVWVGNETLMTPREQHFFPGITQAYQPKSLAVVSSGPGGRYCHTLFPYPATIPDLVATLPDGITVALRCGHR